MQRTSLLAVGALVWQLAPLLGCSSTATSAMGMADAAMPDAAMPEAAIPEAAFLPCMARPDAGRQSPYVWGYGLGVSDLDAATKFFTTFLDLQVEQRVALSDRQEVTLSSTSMQGLVKGIRVVLVKFNDGRATENIPAKVLCLVPDTPTLYQRILDAGFASNFPPTAVPPVTNSVAQVRGPDGYAIEISQFGTPTPVCVGVGIGISDPIVSQTFYQTVFGMAQTSTWPLGGIAHGSVVLPNEVSLDYPTGLTALILLSYPATDAGAPMLNFKNNPVQAVHVVQDVAAVVSNVESAGGLVVQPLSALPEFCGAMGAVVKDPDGYLIEVVER
jgi:predicted enzyme related to lactoylglutathione lyase